MAEANEAGNVIEFPHTELAKKIEAENSIPENAVGVGGTVPPAEAPKLETVKVSVTGILNKPDAQPVQNHMELNREQGSANGPSIAYVWSRISAMGGLVFDDSPSKVTFFPLNAFEKITVEVGEVVGVTV